MFMFFFKMSYSIFEMCYGERYLDIYTIHYKNEQTYFFFFQF